MAVALNITPFWVPKIGLSIGLPVFSEHVPPEQISTFAIDQSNIVQL